MWEEKYVFKREYGLLQSGNKAAKTQTNKWDMFSRENTGLKNKPPLLEVVGQLDLNIHHLTSPFIQIGLKERQSLQFTGFINLHFYLRNTIELFNAMSSNFPKNCSCSQEFFFFTYGKLSYPIDIMFLVFEGLAQLLEPHSQPSLYYHHLKG